jgi:hypothetical protein
MNGGATFRCRPNNQIAPETLSGAPTERSHYDMQQ